MFQQRELLTIARRGLQRNLHRTVDYCTVDYRDFRGVLKRDGREFYVVVSGGERHKIENGSTLVIYKNVRGKPHGYHESYYVSL